MVDDILLSPEEQDERAKRWLKDNGLALIVGVALGLAAIYGYNSYKDQQKINAEQASTLYDLVLSAVNQSDIADIEDRVQTLKNDHAGSSYAAKAVLIRARQLSLSDLSAALAEYKWVAENTQEIGLRHTARIRQAKILLAQGDLEAAKVVASAAPYDSFDSYYEEILGDIAARQKAFDQAKLHYQKAIDAVNNTDIGYKSVLTLKMDRLPLKVQTIEPAKIENAAAEPVASEDIPADAR